MNGPEKNTPNQNQREELKRLIVENPDVCDKLLEIVRAIVTSRGTGCTLPG